MSNMDQFREFVVKHPLLRDEVKNGKTWQSIYEEWYFYKDDDSLWDKYIVKQVENEAQSTPKSFLKLDNVKGVVENIKKIDPNKINNTLNSVQKVIQIAQSVTGTKGAVASIPLNYSDWWE